MPLKKKNSFSKRLQRKPAYKKLKLFLKRLTGRELRLRPELNVAIANYGDWWLCPNNLSKQSVVYSLGIGNDIAFDLELIKQFDLSVHGFDPTPFAVKYIAEHHTLSQFHFHLWAVTGEDCKLKMYPRSGEKDSVMWSSVSNGSEKNAIEVPGYTLTSIMQQLGHTKIDLLKMDIEGSEYAVIDSMIALNIRPTQLLVEFHHRFPAYGLSYTEDAIRKLRNAGYKIIAVSDTGREVSFMLN